VADVEPTNDQIADVLERIAELLETQRANPFRVRAYRDGAVSVRQSPDSVARLARREGIEALDRLPGIGASLAGLIADFVTAGRSALLERLEGEVSPEAVLERVPGVGPTLAHRVHEALGVDSLEELELAAHDGRLATVEGFGEERVNAVRTALAGMLNRSAARRARQRVEGASADEAEAEAPGVATLLDVDEEYRERARAGELPTIAPTRFNPEGEAWLPILHTHRGDWTFTALFSNTAQAHRLGKTDDWVVLYFERDGVERQATVVTASQGPLAGRRVVRGREAEVRALYEG
jgi:hypothetical protein